MRMSKLFFVSCFAAVSTVALAGRGGPCVDDARKLCAGISVAGGQLQECLKKHLNELSASCKAQYGGRTDAVKGAATNVKESCGSEVQKWCKGISPMGGALQKCIQENSKNLSEGCRGSLNGLRGNLVPQL